MEKSQDYKINQAKNNIIEDILSTNGSTVKLLENFSLRSIKAELVMQHSRTKNNTNVVIRNSLLYLSTKNVPISYNECILFKDQIQDKELDLLLNDSIPIGTIFKNSKLVKTEITVNIDCKDQWNIYLKVDSSSFYVKKYFLWADGVKIAQIKEVFNDETLSRVWQ